MKDLEVLLFKNPQDKEVWLVYADWLQTQADIRGELISLYYALEEIQDLKQKKILEKQIERLLQANRWRFLHEKIKKILDKNLYHEVIILDWWNGFVIGIEIDIREDEQEKNAIEALILLLKENSVKFLQNIMVKYADYVNVTTSLLPILIQNKPHLALKKLVLQQPNTINLPSDLQNIFPQLQTLVIQANAIIIKKIQHTLLQSLSIQLQDFTQEQLLPLLENTLLPNLQVLILKFSGEYDFYDEYQEIQKERLHFIQNLLQNNIFPNLNIVHLQYTEHTNALIDVIRQSSVFHQIKELDLSFGCMTAQGAQKLIEYKEDFMDKKIILSHNFIQGEILTELQEVFANIVLQNQHNIYDYYDDNGQYDAYD